MWSRSNLKAKLARPFAQPKPRLRDLSTSPALELQFDELVAMRDRRLRFGQDQRIDGFRFGDRSSLRRGAGLELDTIGPYQWGDDIRHMDWLATARIGRPQVKQFRHDIQQTVLLVIDLRPSMLFGSYLHLMAKTACLAAAKIAWSIAKDHQPLGLLILEGKEAPMLIPPKRGRRACLQCLARIIEAYQRAITHVGEPSPSLSWSLEKLPSHMSGDVETVIISDFSEPGDQFDQRLQEAGAQGALSAILVEDHLMRAPPPSGLYPLRGALDVQPAMIAIRRNEEALYESQVEHHRSALINHLMSLDMRQVLITDAQSIKEGYFR